MADLPVVEELEWDPGIPWSVQSFADWPGLLLLDSARYDPGLGRFSFLSADPVQFEQIAVPQYGSDPFARLRPALHQAATPAVAGLPPFQGGAAGLLSYELAGAWERLTLPRLAEGRFPALAVGIYDWVLAWDHLQSRVWIISQGLPEVESALRQARARKRLGEIRSKLHSGPVVRDSKILPGVDGLGIDGRWKPSRSSLPGVPGLTSNFSRDEYLATVRRAIEFIRAGDIFQVNLSQQLVLPLELSPVHQYLRLRQCNPAPFAGLFCHDEWVVASSSPERFVAIRDGVVETRPIKGTRQRRFTPEADLFTRDELRESEKDQAENVMIVDLLRNDLSRVCRPGTVRVPELCRVETYETVQHLVSVVEGGLQPGKTAWDLFAAAFPGGSITGAPKVRAMEIIAELEAVPRGPYCGSLFYVGLDGSADSSILIRTLCLQGGRAVFPVGGGIVAQSDPADEYAETLHKAAGMLRAFARGPGDLAK